MDLNHIAPCGIDCVNCDLFRANGKREAWERAAAKTGRPAEEMACEGCRAGGGCSFFKSCETLACSRERGLSFCSECADFPCRRLQPLAEGAAFYPHNYKIYNLSVIKARGVEALLAEAPIIRKLYYTGEFRIGAGPQEE
jgi:hypothetical protein